LLQRVLDFGFTVLVMDIDFAVLRNPFIYLHSLQPLCDLTLYEEKPLPVILGNTSWVKRKPHLFQPEVNTGFLFVRPSSAAKNLVADFLQAPQQEGYGDQTLFNRFMAHHRGEQVSDLFLPLRDKSKRCGDWKGVPVRFLSPAVIGSWRQYYEFNLSDWTQETPYAIHYNWVIGFAAKKQKMAEHGYWLTDQA
jgi:hypothetical protein